ncbi:hypothetical protein QYE76_012103 [Lolium multiflorum]|uniref:Reverse transcriptase zinc-binding domain-containing protein n=1 Tax=Lolium multiflorum TaxID=4521 RepID=A0AAD8TWL6_LOLMU|nr:hypothetical protein QYE76_012103 [Lolium multiflorum]
MVVASVNSHRRNRRSVREALLNHTWINDVGAGLGLQGCLECLMVLALVGSVTIVDGVPDTFRWPWSGDGRYSAQSTYKMLCQGDVSFSGAVCVWKSWAPLKCKIFAWMAWQGRLWTSDRRMRHGLQPTTSACYTCLQEEDTVKHIMAGALSSQSSERLWSIEASLSLDLPRAKFAIGCGGFGRWCRVRTSVLLPLWFSCVSPLDRFWGRVFILLFSSLTSENCPLSPPRLPSPKMPVFATDHRMSSCSSLLT